MAAPLPIDQLCCALEAEFDRDPRGPGVPKLLSRYQADHEDWRSWTHFSQQRYTRNLVARCGSYELLLLCWEEGQESPIHDHADQRCWMGVLQGELEEVHYRTPAAGGIEQGRVQPFQAGQVAFIDDDIAFHLIRPRGGRAVSLHLYSNPIDTCRIFCAETGRAETVAMGYHSVRGQLCAGDDPATIREQVLAGTWGS